MNYAKLRAQIHLTGRELKQIKKIFREPHQPHLDYGVYKELWKWRKEANLLYSLRAHLRGKIHLARRFQTLEDQAAFINSFRKTYEDGQPQASSTEEQKSGLPSVQTPQS